MASSLYLQHSLSESLALSSQNYRQRIKSHHLHLPVVRFKIRLPLACISRNDEKTVVPSRNRRVVKTCVDERLVRERSVMTAEDETNQDI